MRYQMFTLFVASLLVIGSAMLIMAGHYGSAGPAPMADKEPPTFSKSGVDPSPETGSSSTFYVDVTDDVKLNASSVELNYKGSTDDNFYAATMSWASGDSFTYTLTMDPYWTNVSYYFSAVDTSNNTGVSKEQVCDVLDVISPTMAYDYSDRAGYTGDDYYFYIIVSDNIEVTEVEIRYWFGSGSDKYLYPDISEGGSGSDQECTSSISVPEGSLEQLHYEVTVFDGTGNSDGPSKTMDIDIYDNDPPAFSDISQDVDAITGGTCTFSVHVTDNVDLIRESVTLYYMNENDGSYSYVLMEDSGSGWFEQALDIDVTWTGLYCYASAYDSSDNMAYTSSMYYYVYDVISPKVLADGSDAQAYTGDAFTFSFVACDNTYISEAYVTYSFGLDGPYTLCMSVHGNGYGEDQRLSGSIKVPDDSLSDLSYYLDIYDRDGNWDGTSAVTVTTEDNDAPILQLIANPTATTGDDFHFNVGISDNVDGVDIKEAHILYSYASDWSTSVNVSLEYLKDNETWRSPELTLDQNTLGPLTYYITALDSSGNWMEKYSVQTIVDDDPPDYSWPDIAPSMGTTGDPIPLSIDVDDNIGIHSVVVVPEYKDGTKAQPVSLLGGSAGTYSGMLLLSPVTLSDLSYRYVVTDTSGNSVETPVRSIEITDNDAPEIVSDMSRSEAGAGSEYIFKTILLDNIGVKGGWVEYWFSYDSAHIRKELVCLSKGLFYYRLQLDLRAGSLYYFFDCDDIFDQRTTSSPVKEVRIVDSVSPLITDLDHPWTATTGDRFRVSARVSDDVSIDLVRLCNVYSDSPEEVEYLSGIEAEGLYTFEVAVRHVIASLRFWIEAVDAVGNPSTTSIVEVPILDNDAPKLGEDGSDSGATTGGSVLFKVTVTDNIAVSTVEVVYELPGLSAVTLGLERDGPFFIGTVNLPNDIKGTLKYRFRATDTTGNVDLSADSGIEVLDDEAPIASISGPTSVDQHTQVTFSGLGSTDNVGLTSYTWTISGEMFTGPEVAYLFDDAGTYLVELLVEDGSNPSVSAVLTLTVRDVEPPTISLQVPERVGNHLTMGIDASGSSDNVGIISYKWTVIMPDHTQRTNVEPSFDLDLKGVLGEVRLLLTVKDAKGNTAYTERTVQIEDELGPLVATHADLSLLTGDLVVLSDLGSTDNVGISEFRWTVDGPRGNGTFIGPEHRYYFSVPGEYRIRLVLVDSSGNEGFDEFVAVVTDPDGSTDSDGDGMPDIWEDGSGLDRNLDDGRTDPDRDTLSNKEEYVLGTDPLDADTDDDGLPDDWEVIFGFDPIGTDDSMEDPDDDGRANIDEYIRNTDPKASDTVKERTDPTLVAISLLVIVSVAVIISLIAVSSYVNNIKDIKTKRTR